MKRILLSIVVMASPVLIYAQGVGIGIKGGVNFANVAAEDINTSSITDFHVGAYVNINLSETFGITPEILWTGQGAELEDVEFATNYVSIPVMLRFKPISLISLEAGPQFSFLTDAEFDGVDYKDQLKSNSFGLALGAGVHFPLGLNGGVRYILGFTNINEVSDDEIKDRTFQIYLGWTLFGAK
jgi:hypothetical protein